MIYDCPCTLRSAYDLGEILKYWNQSQWKYWSVSYWIIHNGTNSISPSWISNSSCSVACFVVCLCQERSPYAGHLEALALDPEEPSVPPVHDEPVIPSPALTVLETASRMVSPTAPLLATLEEASSTKSFTPNCPVKSLYNFSYKTG